MTFDWENNRDKGNFNQDEPDQKEWVLPGEPQRTHCQESTKPSALRLASRDNIHK